MTGLRDDVNQQTPSPRLCSLGERPRKGVFAVLVGRVTGRSSHCARDAGDVSPAHCRETTYAWISCVHDSGGRGRCLVCGKNLKAAIRRFENCRQNERLPGIETDDSGAPPGAIISEEVKQSRIRVGICVVRVLKVDEIFRAGTAVAIVSGVKDAVGPAKLPHAAGGPVDVEGGSGPCFGGWR